ncbi:MULTISPECIES: hypothetical protein [Cupriavidus]
MSRTLDHVYILAMILLTTYSQVVMRWQVGLAGALPDGIAGKIAFVAGLLINPWVLTTLLATFLAGVVWMLALSKFELSYAYPFVSIVYLLVLASGVVFFHDDLSWGRVIGTVVVLLGVVIIARAG